MAEKYSLPIRIGAEEVIDFIEKATYHPGSSEDELKKRLMNPREIASTRRACTALGLVEESLGKFTPTDLGKRLVYAEGEERQTLLLEEVLLSFEPYEIPLTHLMKDKNAPFEVQASDLQKHWTLNLRLGLSKDAMDRAANTLFKLLEAAGVGTYLVGRRGKPTRLEMTEDGFERLSHALQAIVSARRGATLPVTTQVPPPRGASLADQVTPSPTPTPSGLPLAESRPLSALSGHQIHQSSDGSVILWIVPSTRSIEFLRKLLPVLEFEAESLPPLDNQVEQSDSGGDELVQESEPDDSSRAASDT
jgi:hypothetical protein